MEIHSIFESHSRLANLKRAMGIKITTPNTPSSYILCARVKKAISQMTQQDFEALKSVLPTKARKQGLEMLVYRQQNNAEILNSDTLSYLWDIREREGALRFYELLLLNEPKLRRMAERRKEVQALTKLVLAQ